MRTESESQGVPGALGWVGPLELLCSLSSAWRFRVCDAVRFHVYNRCFHVSVSLR